MIKKILKYISTFIILLLIFNLLLFAGSLYLAAAIGALLIAHDSKKEGTSTGACWLITLLDVGIFFVHQASLLKSSPELGEMFIGFLAAAICAMAIASVWLVRDSKIEKVIWR